MAPSILKDVCRQAESGSLPLRAPLARLFEEFYGCDQSREAQLRFLFFAAPIVRQITVASVDDSARVGASEITFGSVRSWFQWLDSTDPMCARMIDLYYFAGMTIKEVAATLRIPAAGVIRELRFARSWLCIQLPEETM